MTERLDSKQRRSAEFRARIRCAGCGERRDALIDFHHVDPMTKVAKAIAAR